MTLKISESEKTKMCQIYVVYPKVTKLQSNRAGFLLSASCPTIVFSVIKT